MEITIAGERVRVVRRQEREILALLLLNAGRWVTVDRIVDLLWTATPPARARETVQTYVSRLRHVLGAAGAPGALERRGDAYRLDVDPHAVDCHRFEALARRAAGLADPAEQALVYGEALRLWSGPALVDAPALTSLREALERRHREVQRGSYAARLDAGHAAEILGELADLVGARPLDEDATMLLMRALAYAGRRGEALEAFARLRVRLSEDLGLDPGAAVADLHARILRGATVEPVARPARTVPAQLPPEPRFFAARRRDLETLADLMKRADSPAVLTVSGLAGVGKTTLAVSLAHRLADTYPDGHLYLDLRGFSPAGAVGPDDALYALLVGLGAAPAAVPHGLDARTGLYRSLLAGRRVLVLLDNARDAEQVRPLLPPGGTSAALVTSRNRLSGLAVTHDTHPVELPLLDPDGAHQVLAGYLSRERMEQEPDAVAVIVERCAGLPLALAVIGAQALTRPRHRLADIVRRLSSTVSHVEDPVTDPHSVFSWSYDQLSGLAARVFRRMSIVPDGELSAPAAQSLADAPPEDLRRALDELVNAGLLAELGSDRFGAHDLLIAYAAELAAAQEEPDALSAARLRLYQHYYETAWDARVLLYPQEPVAHETLATAVRAPLTDADDARRWLTAERANLVHTVADLADRGWNEQATGLGRAIGFFLDRAGHWNDWLTVAERLLPVAELLDDDAERGWLHRSLGYAYLKFGREDEAETQFRRAIECLRRTGNRRVLGNAMNGLAHMYFSRGDYTAVCAAARDAYEVFREAGHDEWAAGSINAIAWAEVHLGEFDAAIGHCREALDMLAAAGFSESTHAAATWDTYGAALHRLGRHAPACDAYRHGARLFDLAVEPARAASTLRYLGDCELDAGDAAAAAESYRQALARAENTDSPLTVELREKLRST